MEWIFFAKIFATTFFAKIYTKLIVFFQKLKSKSSCFIGMFFSIFDYRKLTDDEANAKLSVNIPNNDTATIQKIYIDKETLWIVMEVICDKCKHENSHAISYISKDNDDELIIDFTSTEDTRVCDGYIWSEDELSNKCNAEYKLCNIKLPK